MKDGITLVLLGIVCMTADSPDFRAWLILTAVLMLAVGGVNCVKVPRKLRPKAPQMPVTMQLGETRQHL